MAILRQNCSKEGLQQVCIVKLLSDASGSDFAH